MSVHFANLIDSLPPHPPVPGTGLLCGRHRLARLQLFTDEGLAGLLDRHPPEDVHIHMMGDCPERQVWRRGARGSLTGMELLQAVRQGRLWVIVLRTYAADPELRAITDTLYDSLAGAIPNFKPFNLSSNLLISSPGAQVYYHADAAPSMLWHIRGRKRFYLYPAYDDDFVAREHLEAIFQGSRGEEIPFRAEFDRAAQVFELEPGDFVSWEQAAPHRIENLDGLNVSLGTEYWTRESNFRQAVYNANAYFRTRLNLRFRSARTDGPAAWAKANSYRVLRRLAPVHVPRPVTPISFRVEPGAPGGFVDIA